MPIVIATLIIVLAFPGRGVLAATSYQACLVPSEIGALDLSDKSKVRVKNTGLVAVTLKGVTGEDGQPVTTDQSFRQAAILTGDEYVLVLRGVVLSTFSAMAFEINVPVELRNGKGSATTAVLRTVEGVMGAKRSVELMGARLHEPLATTGLLDCQANMDDGGIVPGPSANPCAGTSPMAVGGITLDP